MLGMELTMRVVTFNRTFEESASVGYIDAPLTVSVDSLFRKMTEGIEEQFGPGGGKVVSTDVSQRGCSGKEIVVRRPGSKFWDTRLYVSGARLYVVIYVSAAETADTARYARAFLDSFEVIGGCRLAIEARWSQTLSTTMDSEQDPATGWRRIDAKEDGFSALEPAVVALTEHQIELGDNTLFGRRYKSMGDAASTMIVAVRGVRTTAENQEPPPKSMLDELGVSVLEQLEKSGVEATFAQAVKFGDHPAKEYTLKARGQTGRAELCVTRSRLYVFIVICKQHTGCEESMNRFLSSIRISGN